MISKFSVGLGIFSSWDSTVICHIVYFLYFKRFFLFIFFKKNNLQNSFKIKKKSVFYFIFFNKTKYCKKNRSLVSVMQKTTEKKKSSEKVKKCR